MKTRSVGDAASSAARRCWIDSSSVRCWRVFSISPRTWVKTDISTDDSAPGATIRFASRNAQISASVRRERASTSLSWFSMKRRASVTRELRSDLL